MWGVGIKPQCVFMLHCTDLHTWEPHFYKDMNGSARVQEPSHARTIFNKNVTP